MANISRGSLWRKWDLHLHTPSSHDYHDNSVSDEEIIDILLDNEISVAAITDHHTIDVERICNLKRIANNRLTILPGIEFCSELGGSDSIHFIGIFPENSDISSIWTSIQGQCKLTRLDIATKGGYENLQCDLVETCDIIHTLGGITSIHAGSKTNSIEGIKSRLLNKMAQKTKILTDSIDILELGKEVDEEGYTNIVFPSIGFNLPMVICSDNHNIKDYKLKQNLWIKADVTFEGLRQIIYEPDERVKIQELKPDTKAGYQVIDNIKFNDPDFAEQEILFNPNLNSIIGGRSTGKSILLGSIAKMLDQKIEVKSDNFDYNAFIDRIVQSMNIEWQDKEQSAGRDIDYFPQGFMFKIAKNHDDLKNLINRIVVQDKDKEELLSNYRAFSANNTTSIINTINKIFQLKQEMTQLQNTGKEIGDHGGIKIEIIRLNGELGKLSHDNELSVEELNQYNSYKEDINKLVNDEIGNATEIRKIETLKNKLFINEDISFEIVGLSDSIRKEVGDSFILVKEKFIKEWQNALELIIGKIRESNLRIQENISKIEGDSIYVKGLEVFKNNQQHNELENKLKIQKEKILEIEKWQQDTNQLNNQLSNYIKKVQGDQQLFLEEFNKIKSNLVIDRETLKIEPVITFNKTLYKEKLNRGINQQSYQGQTIASFNSDDHIDFSAHLNDLFSKLYLGSVTLKGGYTSNAYMSDLMSTDYFDISYNIIYDGDNFNNMSEGKQAFVILKLLLEFSNKTCPILIDQPEDDLDNRAIYKELAAYLKFKKRDRQIILVTHNPNIAVGADSELIIVANQDGLNTRNSSNRKFEYISGSLENTKPKTSTEYILESQGIKEHVCDILEGGNDAFKQRERKYAIA